jgi:hypothetical protein
MAKGYIVNESFFFMFKFLKQMHIDAPLMWDGDHDEEQLEGEKLETNGETHVSER